MLTNFKPLFTFILAGALSTLSAYSMAQPSSDPSPSAGPAAHAQGMSKHDQAKMQARMAQRLTEFKTKLKITPTQEAAWATYTDAIKPTPRASIATSHADLSKLPTPERLDRMRALHIEHMAAATTQMDQRADATNAFYADLSANQKKIFDEQFSRLAGDRGAHRAGEMGGQHSQHHPR